MKESDDEHIVCIRTYVVGRRKSLYIADKCLILLLALFLFSDGRAYAQMTNSVWNVQGNPQSAVLVIGALIVAIISAVYHSLPTASLSRAITEIETNGDVRALNLLGNLLSYCNVNRVLVIRPAIRRALVKSLPLATLEVLYNLSPECSTALLAVLGRPSGQTDLAIAIIAVCGPLFDSKAHSRISRIAKSNDEAIVSSGLREAAQTFVAASVKS